MRANAGIMYVIGVFFLIAASGYTVWVGLVDGWDRIEWVGTVALGLTAVMGFFLGFYLDRVHRAQGSELPQDVPTANIDDDDPEIGHFAPWSWWPLVLGFAIALVFLGLAVGVWISFIGAPLVLLAIVGWNYEFYRNYHAR